MQHPQLQESSYNQPPYKLCTYQEDLTKVNLLDSGSRKPFNSNKEFMVMGEKNKDEQIIQISKEIVVKFIETGRISPSSFPEAFRSIYQSINDTVKENNEVKQ